MSYRKKWPLLLGMALVFVAGLTGPVAAQQPNLTYHYYLNWQYPAFPTDTYCPVPNVVPPTLPGNSTIYLNDAGINNGSASALGFTNEFRVDGETFSTTWIVSLLPGDPWAGCGVSASVRGGRHTFELVADVDNDIVESNEDDNVWARQFVLTPYVLSEATPKTRGAPPLPLAGVSSIVEVSPISDNCDGFRFSNSGWWNAVTMYAQDNADDYDLDLFAPSVGSNDGFFWATSGSYAVEGYLEAVIVNSNTVPLQNFDVGVNNFSGSTGQFVIEQVVSQPAYVGDSITAAFGTDEYLRIWDTYVGDTGWLTVSVTDLVPGAETVWVGLIGEYVTEIGLYSINDVTTTDENGRAYLHVNIPTTGYYGLVVHRNPLDGGLAKTIQIDIQPTSPDLRPHHFAGWHAPLVPTPVPQGPGSVVLPDTLHGYMPETYFNFTVENNSATASPAVDVGVFQDGMPWATPYVSAPMIPFMVWGYNDPVAREIPGGRHTLALDADYTDSIQEFNEYNNAQGEQFCWSPLELALGGQYGHPAGGDITGGWETIDSGVTIFFNCDGYRLNAGSSEWEGMVLTQGPNSDYDLSVHHPLVGVKDGFNDNLVSSYFLEGFTDYVLFNNQLLSPGPFDVGVEQRSGDEPYIVEAVGSTNLPDPVSGRHGPYTMPLSNMLHLYNIYLAQDLYAFRLDNLAGAVDWGLTLHSPIVPFSSRLDEVPGGSAFLNGPGDPEWFAVDVPSAGWYCLAVFKAGPFDFDLDGTYQLTIMRGVSGVSDESDLPSATALAGVHPNPFNPQTAISYELAAAAAVELAIYDLKGARVRRLVSTPMPAGRHEAIWNGQDDAGARVASGVYLARFIAGDHREVRKVMMVK